MTKNQGEIKAQDRCSVGQTNEDHGIRGIDWDLRVQSTVGGRMVKVESL